MSDSSKPGGEIPQKKTRNKKSTCTDCNEKFPKEGMAANKRICLSCHATRVAASRAKQQATDSLDIDISSIKTTHVDLTDAFENRDALSTMLKGNLAQAINDCNEAIAFQKKRLQVATERGNAKQINDASKALEAARKTHVELTTKLMDKLQAMDDLRAKEEKSKPVAFFLITDPAQPLINPMRQIPSEFYPADKQAGESDAGN